MPNTPHPDMLLVEQIRSGKPEAWNALIAQYEGRLLSFVDSRLRRRASSEDVVQETFIGFLTSLPNFDGKRSLESYLFAICAYKLTDHLRREGRRPALPLSQGATSDGSWHLAASDRRASTILRSGERRQLEADSLAAVLADVIERWQERGEWEKIKCAELLIVRGWPNKEVAQHLGITEQQVANQKFDLLARLRTALKKQNVSEDVFPELYESQ
jgi:RNA polymerase sigma-70 factor, ECF subfamily